MKSGKPEGRFDIISITLKHKMLYIFLSDAFKINHKAKSLGDRNMNQHLSITSTVVELLLVT